MSIGRGVEWPVLGCRSYKNGYSCLLFDSMFSFRVSRIPERAFLPEHASFNGLIGKWTWLEVLCYSAHEYL